MYTFKWLLAGILLSLLGSGCINTGCYRTGRSLAPGAFEAGLNMTPYVV